MDTQRYEIHHPLSYDRFCCKKFIPVDIGAYIVDKNGEFKPVGQPCYPQLIELHHIDLPLDLDNGFDPDKPHVYEGADISYLLRWIVENKFDLKETNIVISRGIMRSLGCTLYDFYKEPWSFVAHKFQNTLYINSTKLKNLQDETIESKRFTYWGIHFEDLITTGSSDVKTGSLYNVVTASILNCNILTRGEVDCEDMGDYVELKTSLEPQNEFHYQKLRQKKLFKTWIQCYLTGVKKILYGFRDRVGKVRKLEWFDVSKLPNLCKEYWSGSAMMSFIHAVFEWVIANVEEGCTVSVSYSGDGYVNLVKCDENVLPDWYKSYVLINTQSPNIVGEQCIVDAPILPWRANCRVSTPEPTMDDTSKTLPWRAKGRGCQQSIHTTVGDTKCRRRPEIDSSMSDVTIQMGEVSFDSRSIKPETPKSIQNEDYNCIRRVIINRSTSYTHFDMKNFNVSEVGHYLVDENDDFHLADKTSFAKLKDRKDLKLPLDLSVGFENWVDKEYVGGSLSYMLRWIVETKFNLKKVDIIMNTQDVITTIGYNLVSYYKKPWYLQCFKFLGKVYIIKCFPGVVIVKKVKETEEVQVVKEEVQVVKEEVQGVKEEVQVVNEEVQEVVVIKDIDRVYHLKPLYYGLQFEDLLTTGNKGSVFSVVTSKMAGYNILTRAEIDCQFDDNYVELKVGLNPRSLFEDFKFRRDKLAEVWLQCYTGGVKKVIYGLRDREGKIEQFRTFNVSEIPDICQWEWSALEMMSFVDDVFSWLMVHTKEGFVTRVRYCGDDFLEMVQRQVSKEELESIFPTWFKTHMGQTQGNCPNARCELEWQ